MQHWQVTWKDWYSCKLSNPEKWDQKHFHKEPGLPPTIKLELDKYLSRPGKTNRLECWETLKQSLHKWHPLFEDHSSKLREYLKTQIGSRYDLEAAKVARDHSTANKNIKTYGGFEKFIEDYRIDYQKLQPFVAAGQWVTSPFGGKNDADNVATCLFKLGV
jgi:hypothetical protein